MKMILQGQGIGFGLSKELLPEPLTPVIQVKVPKGILRSTFFKLWPEAPLIVNFLLLPFLRFSGVWIFFNSVEIMRRC